MPPHWPMPIYLCVSLAIASAQMIFAHDHDLMLRWKVVDGVVYRHPLQILIYRCH